jgi:hypothetical protein
MSPARRRAPCVAIDQQREGRVIDAVETTHRLFGVDEHGKRQVQRLGDRSRATGITVEIDAQQDRRIDAWQGRNSIQL